MVIQSWPFFMYFLRRINLGINTYERSAGWSRNHNRIIVAASSLDLLLLWRISSSSHTHCHYRIIILVDTAHSSCCGTLSYRHRRRRSVAAHHCHHSRCHHSTSSRSLSSSQCILSGTIVIVARHHRHYESCREFVTCRKTS
jgi:hypothetical protein